MIFLYALAILAWLRVVYNFGCITQRYYLFLHAGVWSFGLVYWINPLFVEILWVGTCPLVEFFMNLLPKTWHIITFNHRGFDPLVSCCVNHNFGDLDWLPVVALLSFVQFPIYKLFQYCCIINRTDEKKKEKKTNNIELIGKILILCSQLEKSESINVELNKDLETIYGRLKKVKTEIENIIVT